MRRFGSTFLKPGTSVLLFCRFTANGGNTPNNADGDKPAVENRISKDRFGTKNTEVIKSTQDTDIIRVKLMPLMLIEEVPMPQRVFTDLELLMMSWSQEQAVTYFYVLLLVRTFFFLGVVTMGYFFYRSRMAHRRRLRGDDKMPSEMKVGSVVYLDVEHGSKTDRVVIGLLNEECPLYCEAFHRKCTASGGEGDSFRGLKLTALIPRSAAIFGEGREMTHDVPGFNERYLPTESVSRGPFRGALSSIPYTFNQQSPNFAIHMCSGDSKPQIFGLVMGGYNVMEEMTRAGVSHQCRPLRDFVVVDCGELCTLDKSTIVPIPWKVYNSVSRGYDADRWGEELLYPSFDTPMIPQIASNKKAWWKFW